MVWSMVLGTTMLLSSPDPIALWSSPQSAQFAVEADTALILRMVRSGAPWPGTPVLVATTGPARLEWVSAEPPARLALPCTTQAALPAPVASIEGEGFFRTQHISRVLVQPVQRDTQGWVVHRRIIVTVTFPPEASRRGSLDPTTESVLSPLVVNGPLPVGGPPAYRSRDLAPPPNPSCKLVVDHRALYTVACEDLVEAGVPLNGVHSASLRLWYHGLEQAFLVDDGGDGVFGPGDRLTFFGDERFRDNPAGRAVEYVSQYSREAAYWLSWNGVPGMRWSPTDAVYVPADPHAPWYWEWVHAEQENVVFIATHNEAFNNEIEWYWQQMNASDALRQFSIPVDEVAAADSFVLRVGLQGGSTGFGHHSKYYATGSEVGESWWGYGSGREALVFDSADSGLGLPSGLLQSPTTTIGVKELPDGPSGTAAYSFLNWIELQYPRRYTVRLGALAFGGPPGSAGERRGFALHGLPDADVRLVNISRGQWLTGADFVGDSLVFSAASGANDHIWLQHASVSDTVRAIVPYREADPPWDSPLRAADYIVVTHSSLVRAADSLASLAEQAHGYRTAIVEVDDLYDNFSYGEIHPGAVRDFLVAAFENWEAPAPSATVLLGDASWDFLGNSGVDVQRNLVPTWGNPGNDYYFMRLTHNGSGVFDWIPDIAVGRLPARSSDEARRMVERIGTVPHDKAAKEILLVAHGSSDWEQTSFATLSDILADQSIPDELLAVTKTIYAEPEGAPGPRSYKNDFAAAWKRGPLLIHFLGRGDFYTWCMEFHTTMPDTLVGPGPLPFLIGGSCHSGRFAMPDSSCLAEVALRAVMDGSGSIGAVSSTGITSVSQAYLWSQYALPVMLSDERATVGQAYLTGILQAGDFLARRYILLTDPAVNLSRPVLPDLTLPLEWLEVSPEEPIEGDPMMGLLIRLTNLGCAPPDRTDSCWVAVYDSSSSGEVPIGQFKIGLPVRADTALSIPWSSAPVRGVHRISVVIDPGDEVVESDEGNNSAARDVRVYFDAPVSIAPLDAELIQRIPQLVVESIPDEAEVFYEFQVASNPGFGPGEVTFDSGSLPAGEFYTVVTPPPLPERAALYWRCRAVDGDNPGRWSSSWSFEIDRLAPSAGWRQRHWGQFNADSLWQCVADTLLSCVGLTQAVGADVARPDSGASVTSTSSAYPGSNPANLIGPGFFIFGNNDQNQTATIDLGPSRMLAGVGAEVWSGSMDRGVWSYLELALSPDGGTYTPFASFGPYPQPNLEIPARVYATVDPPMEARYIRARFGAGCPHPEALWGSRIYGVSAYPLLVAREGRVVSTVLGPAASWTECSADAVLPLHSDSVLVTVAGYSMDLLSWEPLDGLADLPAPGAWPMTAVDPEHYPWIRLEARLVSDGGTGGPRLTGWSVLYEPR